MFIFLVILVIGLAVWKGGGPFRKAGNVIEEGGKTITRFGDFVDDVKSGGEKVHNTYNQLKETVSENDLTPLRKK